MGAWAKGAASSCALRRLGSRRGRAGRRFRCHGVGLSESIAYAVRASARLGVGRRTCLALGFKREAGLGVATPAFSATAGANSVVDARAIGCPSAPRLDAISTRLATWASRA